MMGILRGELCECGHYEVSHPFAHVKGMCRCNRCDCTEFRPVGEK